MSVINAHHILSPKGRATTSRDSGSVNGRLYDGALRVGSPVNSNSGLSLNESPRGQGPGLCRMSGSTVDGLEELLSGLVQPFCCLVVAHGRGGLIEFSEGHARLEEDPGGRQ